MINQPGYRLVEMAGGKNIDPFFLSGSLCQVNKVFPKDHQGMLFIVL